MVDSLHSSHEGLSTFFHVVDQVNKCRLGLFKEVSFMGVLRGSTSTSGGASCIFVFFGNHTFVPISLMC